MLADFAREITIQVYENKPQKVTIIGHMSTLNYLHHCIGYMKIAHNKWKATLNYQYNHVYRKQAQSRL